MKKYVSKKVIAQLAERASAGARKVAVIVFPDDEGGEKKNGKRKNR